MACDAWWRFWCECRELSRLRAGSSVVELSIAARMVTDSNPVLALDVALTTIWDGAVISRHTACRWDHRRQSGCVTSCALSSLVIALCHVFG